MKICNICTRALGKPIFESTSRTALTSLCELRDAQVRVWCCQNCGHLLSDEFTDSKNYYKNDYRILIDHEDEDQIYEVHNDRIIYRTDHQVSTLLTKLRIPERAMLLDYGCAKASTPRKLLSSRSDIAVHLFDVSEMYAPFWDSFLSKDRYAMFSVPNNWTARFDVVTSFFALEHIATPRETVSHIATLLKKNGVFYGIVPDTFGNVADFVVVDHINHFTTSSLHHLLSSAGFTHIEIDSSLHRGALVFTASMQGFSSPPEDMPAANEQSLDLAKYWYDIGRNIRRRELKSVPAAIYGSGFYGAYLFSALEATHNIECFLDRNPFQQRKRLFDKPIFAPEKMPLQISVLYVGLSPRIAHETIASMNWPNHPKLRRIFLDGTET